MSDNIKKATATCVVIKSEDITGFPVTSADLSKQLQEESDWMEQNDLIVPPYSPLVFLQYLEMNATFSAIVHQIARDVVGLGWKVKEKEGTKANDAELTKINEFLSTNGTGVAFRNMLNELLIDWGTIGWFCIEVARNAKGEVSQVYRVPAHTVRVHGSNQKYAQVRLLKKVWFKKFGIAQDISSKDGKDVESNHPNKANELIFYKNHYPKSEWYGAPNIISALGDVIGLIECRDYNLSFFKNYGVPAGIVTLEGDWDDNAVPEIEKFFKTTMQGSANSHKTLVIGAPPEAKVKYEPLSDNSKEGSFHIYQNDNKENVLSVYSMPPARVGIQIKGALGGNTNASANKIYISSVVEPLQTDMEEIINTLFTQGLGIQSYELKFTNLETESKTEKVTRLTQQIAHGMSTPNQARAELGLEPYEDTGGDTYYLDPKYMEIGTDEKSVGE